MKTRPELQVENFQLPDVSPSMSSVVTQVPVGQLPGWARPKACFIPAQGTRPEPYTHLLEKN